MGDLGGCHLCRCCLLVVEGHYQSAATCWELQRWSGDAKRARRCCSFLCNPPLAALGEESARCTVAEGCSLDDTCSVGSNRGSFAPPPQGAFCGAVGGWYSAGWHFRDSFGYLGQRVVTAGLHAEEQSLSAHLGHSQEL